MPFNTPAFNLPINVWHWASWLGTIPPPGAADFGVMAQLRVIKTAITVSTAGVNAPKLFLCLPAGTDVRGNGPFSSAPGNPDLVEVPAGSSRYYEIVQVDDVAKGFANEYRFGALLQRAAPHPLP